MSEPLNLTGEQKLFIIQYLAAGDTPSQVGKAFKDQFGVKISRQAVHRYDPTKKAGAALSPELKEAFDQARTAHIAGTVEIAAAHRSIRIRRLERMSIAAEEAGNLVLAAALLEQIARECGGLFTNKQQLEHRGLPAQPLLRIERVIVDPAAGGERQPSADAAYIVLPDNDRSS